MSEDRNKYGSLILGRNIWVFTLIAFLIVFAGGLGLIYYMIRLVLTDNEGRS